MSEKFVYFDVGGVVIHFSGGLRAMATKHGLEYADFERVWRQNDDKVCRGEILPSELWQIYQSELGFVEDIDFLKYWVSNFNAIKETHKLMADLVQAGIPIGLLTNIYVGTYDEAIRIGAIPNLTYRAVIQSCQEKLVKPELGIYQVAQQKSGVNHDSIIFVDDKPEFLKPARQLGWTTIQFLENEASKSAELVRAACDLVK